MSEFFNMEQWQVFYFDSVDLYFVFIVKIRFCSLGFGYFVVEYGNVFFQFRDIFMVVEVSVGCLVEVCQDFFRVCGFIVKINIWVFYFWMVYCYEMKLYLFGIKVFCRVK